MLVASEPVFGSDSAKQRMPLALDRRHQVALLLLLGTTEQDVVGAAAEVERHQRTTQLHRHERIEHRAQIGAAVLLGGLQSPQTRGPRVGLQRAHGLPIGKALAADFCLLDLR